MSKSDRAIADLDALDAAIERVALARLPTPVREHRLALAGATHTLSVKLDNLTSDVYGGNKVRKLEYLLPRARRKARRRIATFGTAGSHHALATALYAARLGYPCTCFLSHQRKSRHTTATLAAHLAIGTHLVPFGGAYDKRIGILRRHLWGQDALAIAPGGSSWQGTYGFVRAGMELAAQVDAGLLPPPGRLYVAAGTLGSAAGLAVGLALSGLPTEVHAVRVSHTWLCNEDALQRSMRKVVTMMRRVDRAIPADLASRTNVRLRHEFFAGGYAHTDDATEAAIAFARDRLDLALEATYTGKAMAALLADLAGSGAAARSHLFWNTYNSAPLPSPDGPPAEDAGLPPDFLRYFA